MTNAGDIRKIQLGSQLASCHHDIDSLCVRPPCSSSDVSVSYGFPCLVNSVTPHALCASVE
jgi:hypothetical protein